KYPLEGGSGWAKRAADTLYNSYAIPKERIISINGGYRELATLEFWIVPKDAEMPDLTPTFSIDDIIYCPEINIGGDGFRHTREQPLKFSVAVSGDGANKSYPVEWSISAGKIMSGQGTDSIQVDLTETGAKKITAGVIIKGLPPECDCHAYNSTEIGLYPYKFDEFMQVPYSEMAARIENLFVQMGYEPKMT